MRQSDAARHARAAALLDRIRNIPSPRVVEVGVFVGQFSELLLQKRSDLHLTMVDSWAPADQLPDAYRLTGDAHAHQSEAEAEENRQKAETRVKRFGNRATVVCLPSIKAAACNIVARDLIFLDADHSYEAVKADLAAWVPHVKAGGWIGGHDYGHTDPRFSFGVKQAVDEWAAGNGLKIELGADFTWFCRLL